MSVEERLREFLKNGRDWERRATTVPGVFILKLPSDGRRPSSLAVEINPVDDSGKPTKKRGLILRSSEELKEFKDIVNNERLPELMAKIDSVNPKSGVGRRKAGGEVIEV
ncbi:MAG: hypothetical protein QXF17_01025 [Ignisphaera sp.]